MEKFDPRIIKLRPQPAPPPVHEMCNTPSIYCLALATLPFTLLTTLYLLPTPEKMKGALRSARTSFEWILDYLFGRQRHQPRVGDKRPRQQATPRPVETNAMIVKFVQETGGCADNGPCAGRDGCCGHKGDGNDGGDKEVGADSVAAREPDEHCGVKDWSGNADMPEEPPVVKPCSCTPPRRPLLLSRQISPTTRQAANSNRRSARPLDRQEHGSAIALTDASQRPPWHYS